MKHDNAQPVDMIIKHCWTKHSSLHRDELRNYLYIVNMRFLAPDQV